MFKLQTSLILIVFILMCFTNKSFAAQKGHSSENNSFIESVAGKNVEYGWINSRLFGNSDMNIDSDGVKNKQIRVFYLIRKSNRKNAPYVVFFNGGPGIALTKLYNRYKYGGFLPDFNIVFIDQRGNGLSSPPDTENLYGLKYYTARYISYDAEKIRSKLLGSNGKWIVFGQSYGGIIARKYIEIYPKNILLAITHGSAKYNATDVAINTELNTIKRLSAYFKKFPEDRRTISKIKTELKIGHFIESNIYRLVGKNLLDLLYIIYAINSDNKVHDFLESLDKKDIASSFVEEISPIATILLDAGKLNIVIAHIDLMNGNTFDEITRRVKKSLSERKFDLSKVLVSKIRLDDNLQIISKDYESLDNLFSQHHFKADSTNLLKIAENLNEFKFEFHVFGSYNDTLAIDSVKAEEKFVIDNKITNWDYHYSNGTHREWLEHQSIFTDVLKEFKNNN